MLGLRRGGIPVPRLRPCLRAQARAQPSRLGFLNQIVVGSKIVTPFFNDWKRFCAVLREIASGENGRPLPSLEAQKRARAVLTECGYTWPEQLAREATLQEGQTADAREKSEASPPASNKPIKVRAARRGRTRRSPSAS
jgi:hypothetical protein